MLSMGSFTRPKASTRRDEASPKGTLPALTGIALR